jgi:hypothetical protein
VGLKVAIVGLSDSTRHLAPWDTEWEVWGVAWDSERCRMHRGFEMHDQADLGKLYGDRLPQHMETIGDCLNLITVENFPFAEIASSVDGYWTCSIAYMLSMAIHEGAEEIALYGVDANDRFGYQKPNLEYLIGFARGRGITVHIPEQSPLCKFVNPPNRDYAGRYGRT